MERKEYREVRSENFPSLAHENVRYVFNGYQKHGITTFEWFLFEAGLKF